jgi:hypothetical protein
MIATTNMVLLASVLASAGLFVALDSAPRKDEAPATFSERFPRPEEMFKPLVLTGATQQGPQAHINRSRKSDKVVANNKVVALDFRTDGAFARFPIRTLTFEVRNESHTTLEKAILEAVALR